MTARKIKRARRTILSPSYRASRYDKFSRLAQFYLLASQKENIHPLRYMECMEAKRKYENKARWYNLSFFKYFYGRNKE